MNYIYNIHNDLITQYYKNIYNSFLFNEENEKIFIINQNYFNPLTFYSHYLKKFNTHLYILFSNYEFIDKMQENIQSEECKNLIHYHHYSLDKFLEEYKKIDFNKIVALHISSIDYLQNIIKIGELFKTNIYLYISLSNKNKIFFKNKLRSFMKINNYEMGSVFDYDQILHYLHHLENFNLTTIKLIENNHYATYGTQKSYLIILKYNKINILKDNL